MNTIAKLTLGTALTLALISPAASAGMADGWTGNAGLSASTTTGNTETTDLGLALSLDKVADIWTHKFDASVDYGEASEVENKNRLYLGYQIDRAINDRTYVYGNANYFSDEFGAFQNGYFIGAGLGYDLFINEPGLWSVEGGVGFRSQETAEFDVLDAALVVTGQDTILEEEFAVRLASDYDYALNEAVSFYNDTELTWAESDTYIWNDIGISAQLAGNLSAKFGVRVDHHTDVLDGIEPTDTITRATLVYTIN